MTQQQVSSIWSVLSKVGGSFTVIALTIIGYFEIDARQDVKATRDMVIELRINQKTQEKDIAYHTYYLDQYDERITKLESKK